jgi:hypothetical protein
VLAFPVAGCWQISARTREAVLKFVVQVEMGGLGIGDRWSEG